MVAKRAFKPQSIGQYPALELVITAKVAFHCESHQISAVEKYTDGADGRIVPTGKVMNATEMVFNQMCLHRGKEMLSNLVALMYGKLVAHQVEGPRQRQDPHRFIQRGIGCHPGVCHRTRDLLVVGVLCRIVGQGLDDRRQMGWVAFQPPKQGQAQRTLRQPVVDKPAPRCIKALPLPDRIVNRAAMVVRRRRVKVQLHAMIRTEIIMIIAARCGRHGDGAIEKVGDLLSQAMHNRRKGR